MLVFGGILAGCLIGFTGGVLGIGGGILAIPLLGLVLDMSQQLAQGTALIMVLPAVLVTIRKYNQYARIDLTAAAIGGAASVAFTWLGARIALGLDPTLLRQIYAAFVLAIALFYFHQSTRKRRKRPSGAAVTTKAPHKAWFSVIGMLSGLAGGIFGVGGSVIAVPLLTTVFRYTQTGAQGLALTMIVPGTTMALITYSLHGQASWSVGIPLAIGSVFMIPFGVKLAYSLPEPRLKLIFACMLLVIMVMLLFKA